MTDHLDLNFMARRGVEQRDRGVVISVDQLRSGNQSIVIVKAEFCRHLPLDVAEDAASALVGAERSRRAIEASRFEVPQQAPHKFRICSRRTAHGPTNAHNAVRHATAGENKLFHLDNIAACDNYSQSPPIRIRS